MGCLIPGVFSPGSEKRVWWQCLSPQKHEWNTTINGRTVKGSRCRRCSAVRNPLSRVAPDIAKQWHPSKNGRLTPDAVSHSSLQRVWWQCPDHSDHEWQATVENRARLKSPCPICAKSIQKRGSQTLAEYDSELAKQWHPTKNGSVTPHTITRGSNHRAWWRCSLDDSHVWLAPIRNRSTLRTGCPFCTARTSRVTPGRSLADRFPEIAREWHPTNNGNLKPTAAPSGQRETCLVAVPNKPRTRLGWHRHDANEPSLQRTLPVLFLDFV